MTPVSVPIVFPKVVPNNWDIWNNVWEQNKKFVHKVTTTRNAGQVPWIGFDIYVKSGVDATDIVKYKCKNINCPELFPSLFDNLEKLPIEVHVVRVLQSLSSVPAHQDFASESGYHSVRSLLFDTNPKQTWWYQDNNNNKHYLMLPKETNTWWYDDSKIKHGTDFNSQYKKQLIMYRGPAKTEYISNIILEGIAKYPDNVLYV
jgi:hypothetical protein